MFRVSEVFEMKNEMKNEESPLSPEYRGEGKKPAYRVVHS
jgi:hypothetical protein